ncbi:hypothetical protein LYSHEL_02870 [Lysobacter helvus]|uniref:ABC transporter permease n=2 Tax=Lysobacteraceae TaxID=32033 RepID=A0ABM7Q1Z1_9GAMM|nr:MULTISPECIES: hypothetical protein [Lysobacter]BCT91263.1 hypothetical protein LYSCAS_02870 [Lysobacter caseinilyticus]BCT94416.1 hypothetical protein LYSHEL_02870 [Lysobacter helvus]
MWDLLKAELLRFRPWALGYAAVHVVWLGFLTRVVDLAQQPLTVYQAVGAVYGATGLLLGLYQMGGYRRPNTWLNLLHRPMPPWQVAAALCAAGAVILAVGVLLPTLVIGVWQDTLTARVVDMRHWFLCLSGWLLACCGYLAGAYAMLANKRYGFAAAAVLLFLALSQATGFGALAVQGLSLALLAALVLVAFRPDLGQPPRGVAGTVLASGVLMFSMFFALVLLGFGVEAVWIAQGSHPNNMAVPYAGGEKESEVAEGKALMAMGLRDARDPEARLWREQAGISEIFQIGPGMTSMPVRNELTNVVPMEFDDDERRVRWVFSHDTMRFQGYSLVDGRSAGTMGVDGDHPFPSPTMPGPDGVLVNASTVYQFDPDAGLVLPRATLPKGETLTGYATVGDDIALLSDRALYFYDARALADDDAMLQPRLRVPVPGKMGDVQRIDIMELLDGYLISVLDARSSYNAEGTAPFQQMLRVTDEGRVTDVGRRVLRFDYPVAWRFQNWYPSPLLYNAQRAAKRALSGPTPATDKATPPVPRGAQLTALVLLALSALLAAWRVRRLALSKAAKAAWVIACAVLGVPAVLALWLLYPPRETLDEAPLTQPALA